MKSSEEKTAIFFAGIFLLLSLVLVTAGLIKGVNKEAGNDEMRIEQKNENESMEVNVGDYFDNYDPGSGNFRKNDPFESVCDGVEYEDREFVVQSGIVCFK